MPALIILRVIRTLCNAYLNSRPIPPEVTTAVHTDTLTPGQQRHVHLLMKIQTLLIENSINEN